MKRTTQEAHGDHTRPRVYCPKCGAVLYCDTIKSALEEKMEEIMEKKLLVKRNVTYFPDGSVQVAVNPEGLPSCEGLVPAPFMDEAQRQALIQQAIDHLYIHGWFVTGHRRIRNEAFDARNEYTTTQIDFRACKSDDEARYVMEQIGRILADEI